MQRRLTILLFCFLPFSGLLHAEGLEHECTLWAAYGGKWQQDAYLSPLLYDGQTVGLGSRWEQMFRRDSAWTHRGELYLNGAFFLNKPKQNIIYNLGVQSGWGADYNFEQLIGVRGLNMALGPCIDLDYSGRLLGSNVNKPYSMDLGLSVGAHAGLSYRFAGKHSHYRVRYEVMTLAVGLQYVPEYWESYYELSGAVADGLVFASFHNKQTVRQMLTLDMQFRHSAWVVGVRHEFVHYAIHGIQMRREEVAVVVGTCFQYVTKIRPYRW